MGIQILDSLSNGLKTQVAGAYACLDKLVQIQCSRDASGNSLFTCACNYGIWTDQASRDAGDSHFFVKSISVECSDTSTMYADLYAKLKEDFTSTTDV